MRLTTILLITTCLQVAAADGFSQRVTLSEKNASYEKVFLEIRKQTGFEFVYNADMLQAAGSITIVIKEAALEEALTRCFEGKPFTWTIIERTIVVKQRTPVAPIPIVKITAIDIKGRITNERGEPVVASIIVKGTGNGATSNVDGFFEMKNVEENAVLVISGVSVETIEVKVAGRSNLVITVKISVAEGEEVVVKTNYWETKRKLNPGNITKVTSKDIAKNPVSNFLQAVQANVPGLEIVQHTGVPGGNFTVRIRGINSIANGNNPLFIIDGVPFTSTAINVNQASNQLFGFGMSPFNGINTQDIESIEVLKDADATAIYGSRGANGVILITTKKGRPGKTRVDLQLYSGAGKVTRKIDLLNAKQYLEMRREAFANDNVTPTVSNANDLLLWDTTRYTDWQKEFIGGTARYTDAQLSVSGGEKNTQFSIGGGYHKETTVFPGDNADQRASVHASIFNSSLNNKLRTSFTVTYSVNNSNLLNEDLTYDAITLPPVAPALLDSNGDLNWTNWNSSYENPLAYLKRRFESRTNNLVANAVIGYMILPNLEVKSSLGYTNIAIKSTTLTPVNSQYPSGTAQHSTFFTNSSFQNHIIEPQLNWKPAIGKSRFDIIAGATIFEQFSEALGQQGTGFTSESLMKNLAAAPVKTVPVNTYSQYRYSAVFGRINYNLDQKYILNITGRRDGSSRFGPGKQFANFGAVGAAWIFSEEGFVKKAVPVLSYGKLRASYGITGNDQLSDYEYLDTYSPSNLYFAAIGLQPDRLSNPEFAWETNRKFEAGLELGLFNDRIMAAISFYRNRSSNQLVGFPLPATAGFTSIQGNFPAVVQNTGIEIEFQTRNIQVASFNWQTSFNISIPRNKLIAFPNIENFSAYANTYVVGKPLQIQKLYNYLGVDPSTGIYTFEDVNKDGSYDFRDRQTIGFAGRYFFGGLQNTFQYKSLQLDVTFQFVKQDGRPYDFFLAPGSIGNAPVFVMDRWKNPGDQSAIQRFSRSGDASAAYYRLLGSQGSVTDASFIRLKNLSLSWTLPHLWRNKIQADNARIFMQAQNLLTITNFKGLDPEAPGTGLPPIRVITAGIQLTF